MALIDKLTAMLSNETTIEDAISLVSTFGGHDLAEKTSAIFTGMEKKKLGEVSLAELFPVLFKHRGTIKELYAGVVSEHGNEEELFFRCRNCEFINPIKFKKG